MHKVVIVGRPNVGKSSLFNRLLKKRSAVVADVPGVTRDLKEGVVETDRGRFLLVDTGGLWSGDKWEKKIQEKVDRALEDAEVVLFAVDGRAELTQADYEVAEYLRRKGKPVILVATKVDDPKHELYLGPLYGLGFGDPIPTSSEHARGLEELLGGHLGEASRTPDRDRARGGGHPARHRGPAQRREVQPLERHPGGGAGHRLRGAGHHPGRH